MEHEGDLEIVRGVATHWRRRYQAAQALLAETQRELAEARRWSAAWKRAAVRYRHELRNLDPRIARLERITPPAPIQGVEDMFRIRYGWDSEDE